MDDTTTAEVEQRPRGGPLANPDVPMPTDEDPTAGGYLCGAKLRQPTDDGHTHCRKRAGFRTDHVGIGTCHVHGGSTPNARKAARLRLAELVGPALAAVAQTLVDPDVKPSDRLRAAENVLDRAGYPRRTDVGQAAEDARETLYERLIQMQASDEATS